MNGIMPLYKPRGMTSGDCVYKLRKILHERRIGHTGTLDPDVDGVLPICIGQGTKLVNRLLAGGKVYQGEITLGFATTTEDLSGDVIKRVELTQAPTDEQIDQALLQLTGKIKQIPPMYSAVKVAGRRLYDYARAGETVERPVRQIEVSQFTRTSAVTFDETSGVARFNFEVHCSKGTYVRTLATDCGVILGIPSVMSSLTRLESAGITLAETVTLAQVADAAAAQQLAPVLWPLERVLANLPQVDLTSEQWEKVKNGNSLALNSDAPEVTLVYQQKIKAIYQASAEQPGLYRAQTMLLQND
ncbi:tRNA pseudouridine(55) synthase TruB [Lapidilactobacillus wuchangensis]|uniref:tRNA pseudouridine(55) synthase TruB n=1 Tax=Lapidilactobacillus wuchangensis TaxID=2486001 RepID=UPI000F7B9404|nr:tRNA pseudouridine(55) synthase TruB [Lapidilactobacillus wuchangensis]